MAGLTQPILSLNCGSTSLKFGLFSVADGRAELQFEGEAEGVGDGESKFWFRAGKDGEKENISSGRLDFSGALNLALQQLEKHSAPRPTAIGHRVVHGGPKLTAHCRLTPEAHRQLEEARDFAPLHVPPALAAIDSMTEFRGNVPQVLCFDTAFHNSLPDVSQTFALPEEIRRFGVRRYGFHGLSLESILRQMDRIPDRLVVAHLGGGCSVTAIEKGRSIETSMGLTPTGGIMMGSRCGDLDPGVLLYLMRSGYADANRLESLLDHESGLKGISGVSSDLRKIEEARPGNADADLAVRMFVYQISRSIAAMAVSLGGLDELVFTGGIGEHSEPIRTAVAAKLAVLGNFAIRAMPSEEDAQIARVTARLTSESAGQ